jgi:vacuolar-type H+-ATPase subunit H
MRPAGGERLRRRATRGTLKGVDAEELIRQAADRVRAALDDAQRRAEEVVREAEASAKGIRAEAEAEAARVRAQAEEASRRIRAETESQAQRRLEQVRNALDDLQGRLSGAEDRRPGATAAQAGEALSPDAELDPGPVTFPEPAPPDTPEPLPEPVPEPIPEPTPPPGETDAASAARANGSEAGEARSPEGAEAAARLVAMKLALDGASRDDARKRLASDYDVADLDALLDEVYSLAGK